MHQLKNLRPSLLATAVALALSACGGGVDPLSSSGTGSSGTPETASGPHTVTPPSAGDPPGLPSTGGTGSTAQTFSGVAAVGAPLVGSVTVKDAAGVTKTVTIGNNGSYSVDVAGMTAPFVFRAVGRANGTEYVVHSAAVAADVNGNINITQLTELVVDNLAGQIASRYFEAGNFASIDKTALDAEAARLKEKLLPVLQSLGVEGSIDLLRSQFTPLQSALDKALDVIRVSVDASTNVATITNIVTQQQITDDLAVKAVGESSPAQLSETTGLATGTDDMTLIKTALANFSSMFATGLPSAATIKASLATGFRMEDSDADTFAAEHSADSGMVGLKFTDVDIKRVDSVDPSNVYAVVDFTAKDKNGVEMDRLRNMIFRKGVDGTWRFAGDRRVLAMAARPHMYRGAGTFNCTTTGIEFEIEDFDPSNNGGAINHITVFGPGLPSAGLRFNPPSSGGWWTLQNVNSAYYVMANSCASAQAVTENAIAAIPDGATYVAVAYSSVDNSTRLNFPSGAVNKPGTFAHGAYLLNIDKRPLTLAEVTAATSFPVITSPATASAFSSFSGGNLSVSAKNLSADRYVDIILQLGTASGDAQAADAYIAASPTGEVTASLSLLAPQQGDTVQRRSLYVATQDIYRRTMMSAYHFAQ